MANEKPERRDSEFLSQVLDSLRKRRRALKHISGVPQIERFVDVHEDRSEERLEVTFNPFTHQRLRAIFWDDRWIQISALESIPKAGWKFEFAAEGRFLRGNDGKSVIAAIEQTLSMMFEATQEDAMEFDQIWAPLLAAGPAAVRP
ncbi:MAG: hypothetical protein AAF127_01860 [Pseudomonadota bacterium]